MKVIVGLGNPGRKYQNTRHNAGFMVVDKIMQNLKLKMQNCNLKFKINKKLNSTICKIDYSGEKIILAKPRTFMNESGRVIRRLRRLRRWQDLWVIHDDLDLALGKLRISQSKRSAGHKGVESIIESLGTDDFVRFRVGIGDIKILRNWKLRDYESYVLGRFKGEKKKLFEKMVEECAQAVFFALKEGIEAAMNKYN